MQQLGPGLWHWTAQTFTPGDTLPFGIRVLPGLEPVDLGRGLERALDGPAAG